MNNYLTIAIILLISLVVLSCAARSMSRTREWTGKTDISSVSKNFDWYREGYKNYRPDSAAISGIRSAAPSYTFIVFGGTWCGDTRKLLPEFYKTIAEAGIPAGNATLYLLDHDKKSPEKLEKKYEIRNIPTFIVLRDGKETGRIVESVTTSVESDLAALLK